MFKAIKNYARKFLGLAENLKGWVTLSGRDTLLKEQERGGFVDASLRAIVSAACNGELQLRNADGSVVQYERKGVNPLLDLLYQPTQYFNENIFKQIVVSQFLLYGNVYILKDARDSRGRPTRLIPIPQPCIMPIMAPDGFPMMYQVNTVEGGYTVRREDIIHIYEGNALNLFWGQSRMLKCKIDADVMTSAKVFNLSFFRNGASVGGVIKFPEGAKIAPDEAQELLKFFNDNHAGPEKAHRTALIAKGGSYESFKTSHKDMEYGEGMKFHQQQILSIMGVPPAMVGLFEFAPQFNTKEQQKIFYETNVIPLMRLIADALSEELVPEFDKTEGTYISYDFSKVKALEPDWEALGRSVQYFAQYWPINEVRDALGLPFQDIPGGDEPPSPILSAFGLSSKPINTITAEPVDVKAISQKRSRLIRPTPAQLKRHKAEKFKFIEEQKEVMEKSIIGHFEGQGNRAIEWVGNNPDTLFDYSACFGSRDEQEKALLAVKVPAMAEIFTAAIAFEQAYLQSLAPNKDFKFTGKKAMTDRVQKWAEMYAFKWAQSIEETTLKRLDRIIKLGVDNGYTNREINNLVLQFFSEEGYEPSMLVENDNGTKISIFDRVDTITRTETLATVSEAQIESYKTTPYVTGKGWVTTMGVSDHHVGHLEMDGQEVRVDDKFYNREAQCYAEGPGQFDRADQDINCMCDTYPVVLDEE